MCTWLNQAPSRERRSCNPEVESSRLSAGKKPEFSFLPVSGISTLSRKKDEKPTVVSAEGKSPEKSGDFNGGHLMKIPSLKLVYFSPTGTTKKVVQGIARGINSGTVEELDITRPGTRIQPLRTSENELLIIGVPVYMGRVPALVSRMAAGVTGA